MQLEFPQHCLQERPAEREESDFDEDQGSVPDYILSSISSFKEGRGYFESGQFLIAREKFLSSVRSLAMEDTCSGNRDGHQTYFGVEDAINFVEFMCVSCEDHLRFLCQSPISKELRKICLPSASHVDRISSFAFGRTSLTMDIRKDDPAFEAKLKGIICAILCDVLSGLASCEEVLGNYANSRILYANLTKLQKLLYGEDTIRCAISLKSLARFFDALGCNSNEELISNLQNPFLDGNFDNVQNDRRIAQFLNDAFLSNPNQFNDAMASSQAHLNDHQSWREKSLQSCCEESYGNNFGSQESDSSQDISSNFVGNDDFEFDFFATFD